MNKSRLLPWFAAALLVLGAACASKQKPAAELIDTAESALAAVREDAGRYVPESLAAVDAKLATLKNGLASKNYDAVIAGGPDLTSSITQLEAEVAQKRQQAAVDAQAWEGLAADVPQMLAAIQSRVDTLSAARSLPRGMQPATLASAKEGLAQMKTAWEQATAAHEAGNAISAAASGRAAQIKGREVLVLLGMPTG